MSGAAGSAPAGRCLLTGASGFIGGALVRRLAREGFAVRCLVRTGSDLSGLPDVGVEQARGELADRDSLRVAIDGCRSVVHCAALVSDWATVTEIERTNVQGTRNLLEACSHSSVQRFVHLSTTDVYGHPGAPAVRESYQPSGFANWYAQTKLEAEREVLRAERAGGPAAVILRPATVYGPGSKDVLGEIARAIKAGHMLLVGGGRSIAGLCYVENLIDAALCALRDERALGETFNITDGLAVTWRELANDLAAGLGAPPVRLSMPYRPASALGLALEQAYRLVRRTTGLTLAPLLSRQAVQVLGIDQDFSNEKARAILGWAPRVGYPDGLAASLQWLARWL